MLGGSNDSKHDQKDRNRDIRPTQERLFSTLPSDRRNDDGLGSSELPHGVVCGTEPQISLGRISCNRNIDLLMLIVIS
jgi:hypothetical protein